MAPRAAVTAELNPRTTHYEFCGTPGVLAIMFGLPVVCYLLYVGCHEDGCLTLFPLYFPRLPAGLRFFTLEACVVWLGWLAFILALHAVLPGETKQGAVLRDGTKLTYKLNGRAVLAAALSVVIGGHWLGILDLGWVNDNYLPLLSASVAWAFVFSAYLYARSFRPGALLAEGGNTGSPAYDFFIGRELNPRIGWLDLKEFCELYPGLIGWATLNAACAARQYELTGSVSSAMLLVIIFQFGYVVDAMMHEPSILTTMDIATDGFGFMLAFGDLTWVPFVYSTQARFLATHPGALSWPALAGVLLLQGIGYAIFRGANAQKDAFRCDPGSFAVAHITYLTTTRGTKLMTSGWWGVVRHVNYTGDWIMGCAWCLPCGMSSPVPYFYAAYFGALLLHREARDDAACRAKYGADWARYCAVVKYRLVPGIY